MDKIKAYKIVYEDLINSGCGLLIGKYDAKNGSREFMYGISTVMEWIAFRSDNEEEFDELFMNNFQKSIDKANNM